MEKRFNLRKLTETVRIQFQSARQSPGEDLDDWAERLLSLADKAFGELPEEFVTSEVITKLCHGTVDKHAGSVAASFRHKAVDEALERIKWQQYNDKALSGQYVRTRNTREIQEPNSENFEENAFQSSVDKNIQAVQAEMKGMERKWENEMEYMKDTTNQIKKTGTSGQVEKGQKTTVEIPLTTVHPPKGIDVGNQVDISETSTVTDGSERIFTTMQLGNSSLFEIELRVRRYTVGGGYVYVAPIDDDMLLGLNFMVAYGVTVDLEKLTFNIGGEMLEMSPGPKRSIPVVSKVVIGKRTVVPPHSVVHVQAKLENQLERYIIEPCDEHLPILIPRCLYNHQDKPSICLVNASDRYYTLKKNSVIAKAEVVNEIEPFVSTNQITEVSEGGQVELSPEIRQLLDSSSVNLSENEKQQVRSAIVRIHRHIFKG
ncbi:Hypothetical predicted protein [Mytilus galloprovincialis]|uniref:Uncharacterized protein n=1 Tax=Mytilus galloprovincialis TaxID=29158 RepID=A0A8B6CHL5_MYTGA|nr:Hypothetical predicted protein [Mytilus galloprovincialis]